MTNYVGTVLALAKKMNGPNYKNLILELNASDDRNIRVVREEIKDFASTIYGRSSACTAHTIQQQVPA